MQQTSSLLHLANGQSIVFSDNHSSRSTEYAGFSDSGIQHASLIHSLSCFNVTFWRRSKLDLTLRPTGCTFIPLHLGTSRSEQRHSSLLISKHVCKPWLSQPASPHIFGDTIVHSVACGTRLPRDLSKRNPSSFSPLHWIFGTASPAMINNKSTFNCNVLCQALLPGIVLIYADTACDYSCRATHYF